MMNAITVSMKVDKEVWVKFKHAVLARHGKLRGALGEEVTEALRMYLRELSEESTHTHKNPSNRTKSRTLRTAERIVEALPAKIVSEEELRKVIARVAGGDGRTLRKYTAILLELGAVRPAALVEGAVFYEVVRRDLR